MSLLVRLSVRLHACSYVELIGDFIIKYASVYFIDSFFIIGGHQRKVNGKIEAVNTIKKINTNNWQWSEVGALNTARAKLGAIMVEIWVLNEASKFYILNYFFLANKNFDDG